MIQAVDKRTKSMRAFLARLIVGVVIIAIILITADLEHFVQLLREIDARWLVVAFGVQVTANFIWAARWSILLKMYNLPVGYLRLVKSLYIAVFFNNLLPTSVGGDVYRSYYVLEDKRQFKKSLFITFMERLIGVIILAYIGVFAFVWHVLETQQVDVGLLSAMVVVFAVCGGLIALQPAVFNFFNTRVLKPDRGLMVSMRQQLAGALDTFHNAGSAKWRVYLLSLLVQFCGVLLYYCVGRSLGLAIELRHFLVIVPIVAILTLLPISFNGLGLREGGLIFITSALGLQVINSAAVALGLLVLGVTLVSSFIGAIFYMIGYGSRATLTEMPSTDMPVTENVT